MNNRTKRATRGPRQAPLDHLRRGGRPRTEEDSAPPEPAEGTTPGGDEAEAIRGKATRSPAEVSTRRHLEGSEQGPM
jgi:hypothetical protein